MQVFLICILLKLSGILFLFVYNFSFICQQFRPSNTWMIATHFQGCYWGVQQRLPKTTTSYSLLCAMCINLNYCKHKNFNPKLITQLSNAQPRQIKFNQLLLISKYLVFNIQQRDGQFCVYP